MHKIFFIFSMIFFSLGFRTMNSAKWSINSSDPTLWVKLCDSTIEGTFGANTVPEGDEVHGSVPTPTQALSSIVNDFNNVTSSYLRLAVYPTDPDNPGTAIVGDSTFTKEKAANRTITACVESSSNPFQGGHASQEIDSDVVTGCEIVLSDSNMDDAFDFISTLTHELGHCVGLAHPMDTTHAIMSYFSDSDEHRLLMDDRMGLVHLFAVSGVDLEEENSYGLACSFK